MSITTDKYQAGISSTASHNVVLDASADDGSAKLGFGMQDSGIVKVLMNMLATGVINFPGGVTADKLSLFSAGLNIGPIGSGAGYIVNANGVALQLPGGFILQMGGANVAAGSHTDITFPVAFPNTTIRVFATLLQSQDSTVAVTPAVSNTVTITGTRLYSIGPTGAGTSGVNWMAIGY